MGFNKGNNVVIVGEPVDTGIIASASRHAGGTEIGDVLDKLTERVYKDALKQLGFQLEFLPGEVRPDGPYGGHHVTAKAKIVEIPR